MMTYVPIAEDGWAMFLLIAAIAVLLLLTEWNDRRRGHHPRDWRD